MKKMDQHRKFDQEITWLTIGPGEVLIRQFVRVILFLAIFLSPLFTSYALAGPSMFAGFLPSVSYQTLSQPFFMHAPWPGKNEWLNVPGSAWHKNYDAFAIDFNGPGGGNSDEGAIVLAAADGEIVLAQNTCPTEGYGCQVVIGHAYGYESRYAHLDEVFVRKGDKVYQGTPIGLLGRTGNSPYAHLHFAVYRCNLDPGDPLYPDPGEPCPSSNLQAVSPQIWDAKSNGLVEAVNASKITSGNFGVGYEEITDIFDLSTIKKHQSFIDAYERFGGQYWVFGETKTPVYEWAGTLVQEFGAHTVSGLGWSGISSTLTENNGSAYLLFGPIWEEYKKANGPQGNWGSPVAHTYEWQLPYSIAYRSDFQNGSIIWTGASNFEFLDENNAAWIGEFFDRPNDFSGTGVKRRDRYLDFTWPAGMSPGPVTTYDGFSAIWQTTEKGFIKISRIIAPEVQGHLQVFVNGKLILSGDSPDREQSFESAFNIGLGDQDIQVRFWQEGGKKARLQLTSVGIIPPAFASDGVVGSESIPESTVEYANFEPPPFPDDASAPSVPTPPGQVSSTASILVVDVSGSMGDSWQGGIKIESAKSAAQQIINMLEQDSQVGGTTHRVGLASFTDDAMLVQALTGDFSQARTAIDSLYSQNRTNIGAGLTAANNALGQAATGEAKIIILLSDGMTNVGLSPDEILAGPVQDAVNAGTCIYTIGFGDQGDIDEDLLNRIAASSGCGKYYYATDISNLENTYIRVRHQSTGNLLAEFSGTVAQGETVQAGTFEVPPGQGELAISLHWPGSRLTLRLRDPQGQVMNENSPGINLVAYQNLVYALILQPVPGTWIAEVVGAEVPQGTEQFNVIVSARAAPPSATQTAQIPLPQAQPGFPVLLVLLLMGGGGVGLYVYADVIRKKRGGKAGVQAGATTARLIFLTGDRKGLVVSLGTQSLSIGRGPANNVQVPDISVSRLHATIRYAQGRWFIQDRGSKTGTRVNGQPVNATALKEGDHIQIGATEMVFRAGSI